MVNNGIGSLMDVRKKLSYDYELIATAHHEAGHTVAGLLNFMMVLDVGLEITKDKRLKKDLGYTNFETVLDCDSVNDSNLKQFLIISEISINNAGLAAEKIFYKDICGTDQLPMVLKSGSWHDRSQISELVKKYNLAPPGKKRYSYKKKLFTKTRKLLELYWDDVKLIAHGLFNRRKLYFADLKALLTKKSINKDFWKEQFKSIETIFASIKASLEVDEAYIYSYLKN